MQQARQAALEQQAHAARVRHAAKEEFASRQRQAMRNKAAAEGQLGIGAAYRSPSPPPSPALKAEAARRRAYAGMNCTRVPCRSVTAALLPMQAIVHDYPKPYHHFQSLKNWNQYNDTAARKHRIL